VKVAEGRCREQKENRHGDRQRLRLRPDDTQPEEAKHYADSVDAKEDAPF
jgi:hypothetical protein